ncbi:MAG: PEP-utilizing enzyme [Acidimicrobiales bacterium]
MVDRWLVETTPDERFSFYTRANIGEVFPDPVAPLSFNWFENADGISGANGAFATLLHQGGSARRAASRPGGVPQVSGGYGYLNASALRLLGHRTPGMTYKDIDDSFFGDAPGVPDFVWGGRPPHDRPELTEKIGATFQWVLTTPDLPDVAADEQMVNQLRADRPDLGALSDRELVDYVWRIMDAHFAHLFAQHIFISFLATLPVGIITKVTAAVGQPTAALKLIAGLGDVESAAPSMAMWSLGRQAAASATLNELFDQGVTGLDRRIRDASGDPDAAAFVEAFDTFLRSYGARGPNEWETRSPTWETEPDLALAAIDRMRLAPATADPSAGQAARAAERQAVGDALVAALAADPEVQGQFQAALHSATVFMPGRERTKTNCIKLVHEGRMALQEWGRRCVAAGTFPQVNSYGLLTRDEMFTFLDDPTGYRDRLAEREQLMREVTALQEPFLFVGSPGPMSDYPRRDAVVTTPVGAGDVLQGVPGCPGTVRGTARVVTDSHDPSRLQPGDILVAPITDPSWTPLFVPAAGVVVDVGAPLSHAIIVSRELGIPCVVSATDATRRIPDGHDRGSTATLARSGSSPCREGPSRRVGDDPGPVPALARVRPGPVPDGDRFTGRSGRLRDRQPFQRTARYTGLKRRVRVNTICHSWSSRTRNAAADDAR